MSVNQSLIAVPTSQLPAFLGVGPAFPWQLDATGARVLLASNDQLVKMSIDQILNTDITERPFLARNGVPYGTRIKRIQFRDADAAVPIITFEVVRALTLWEPRIMGVFANATLQYNASGGATVIADIGFRYRSTNAPDNFVLPFLLTRPSSI